MRILLAPDKFKGSLTAGQVAAHVEAGLREVLPHLVTSTLLVADGGDGTLDAAVASGFERVPVLAHGPTGDDVESAIGVRGDVAVVELATVSGLAQLPGGRLEPLRASSFGVGELLLAALDAGCGEVVLGVGGSACTDGGAGMLQALGVRLLDAQGAEVGPGGGELARVASVDVTGLDARLATTDVVLATDVDNPLTGPLGAAAVYGPQKGATPDDVSDLDAALVRFATLVDADAAVPSSGLAGAGAAGGVGFAALAVLGARRRPGIEVVLELAGFAERLAEADLVVTGEGSLDEQTLHGKAVAGVAAAARAAGVPCVAVCGQRRLDPAALSAAGIVAAYALTDVEPDVRRCIEAPGPLLEQLGRRIAAVHAG
ncbi:MAG TPA: glycerate kinase [Actinomycetales bacterium]|jgi:glycerate kinase